VGGESEVRQKDGEGGEGGRTGVCEFVNGSLHLSFCLSTSSVLSSRIGRACLQDDRYDRRSR
jgi:hypothetical protein